MREQFRLRTALDTGVAGRHRMGGVTGDPGDAAALDGHEDAAVAVADPAERLPNRAGAHAVALAGVASPATSAATSGRTLAAAVISLTRSSAVWIAAGAR